MSKSNLASALDRIQRRIAPILLSRGFKARGRTFNRTTPDGLTHVLSFQMGSFDPPGTTYHAGLRENLYGRFTINLGIYIPEVAKWHGGAPSKPWVPEHYCSLRTRLGRSESEDCEHWWSLTLEQDVIEDLVPRVERDAIQFFARFNSHEQVLSELQTADCRLPAQRIRLAVRLGSSQH